MNAVQLMGNLARDPELRHAPDGKAICEVTICHSDKWKGQDGQQKEAVAFVSVVIWGPRGEAFAKHHRKGDRALVEGKLVQDTWTDKATGAKREKLKVHVERWHFCNSKPAGERPAAAPAPRQFNDRSPTAPTSSEWPDAPVTPPEDDVPF
jgi:single-strand DNA-binding protein